MNITIEDLSIITEDVLATVVGLVPTTAAVAAVAPTTEGWLAGKVEVHGRSSAELAITCGPVLGATLATAFFGGTSAPTRVEDAVDALLELANILAGHVNALMAAPSRITLPSVVAGAALSPSAATSKSHLVVAYSCNGEGIIVTVREITGASGGA